VGGVGLAEVADPEVLGGPERVGEGVRDSEPVGPSGTLAVDSDGLREPVGPSGTLAVDSDGLLVTPVALAIGSTFKFQTNQHT